jgi:predicted MPP superfamily phosphohydrolase
MTFLLVSILLFFLTALTLNAVFVFIYNQYLAMMHESSIKKVVALGGLPMGTLLSLFLVFQFQFGSGGFAASLLLGILSLLGLLILLAEFRLLFQRHQLRWGNIRTEVNPFPLGSPVPFSRYSPVSRFLLWFLQPINQVGSLRVHHVRLTPRELPGLKPEWNGYTIVHFTDWHLHHTLQPEWTEFVFREIQRQKPDLILFGGDFLSKYPHVNHVRDYLPQLKAPDGVFFVRGNHDFWKSPSRLKRMAEELGWRLLSNSGVVLQRGDSPLSIQGLESPYIPLMDSERLQLRASPEPRLCLVHTPEAFALAREVGAAVAIAGHTHGGQMRLPFFGTVLSGCGASRLLVDGPIVHRGLRSLTSRGVGAFFPLRVLCPPEFHVFHLEA